MLIALGQTTPGEDIAMNLAQLVQQAHEAKAAGAELIIFPEFSMYCKKKVDASFAQIAQPLNGEFASAVSNLARELVIAVVIGLVEEHGAGKQPYNTLAAFDRVGSLVCHYRKIHLFDAYGFEESEYITTGETGQVPVFEVSGIKFGLQTCYDLRFPEISRRLSANGVEVLIVSAAWVPGLNKVNHWVTLATARAIENTAYTIAVSQGEPISTGSSLAVDPDGNVLAQAGGSAQVLTVEINLEKVFETRQRDPNLVSRRLP